MYKLLAMVRYDRNEDRQRWQESLEAAQDELVDALQEKESLEWRIRRLQEDIGHLAALCGVDIEDPVSQLGLTDAIRYVIGAKEKNFMTPLEVKDALASVDFDINDYKNVMASIHAVLKRLEKKGEINRSIAKGGSYVWSGKTFPPLPPLPKALRAMLNGKAIDEVLREGRKESEGWIPYDKSPAPPKKRS
jgi:hypothetical protein